MGNYKTWRTGLPIYFKKSVCRDKVLNYGGVIQEIKTPDKNGNLKILYLDLMIFKDMKSVHLTLVQLWEEQLEE